MKSEGKVWVQSYLTSCDKCVLWLSYINLNLTGELPSQIYDPAFQMSGKIVSKVDSRHILITEVFLCCVNMLLDDKELKQNIKSVKKDSCFQNQT